MKRNKVYFEMGVLDPLGNPKNITRRGRVFNRGAFRKYRRRGASRHTGGLDAEHVESHVFICTEFDGTPTCADGEMRSPIWV
ncbi:MAG: hypothetical protein FWB96_10325 [Defluviitaleaceae bacterium]|nr:hypothetical protein [Defluviitaleaceae bacterium]MCL2263286.1 hypothetical protein [Defluviitaleaceae bacterium]